MSSIYLVALVISHASGNVESIKTVDAVTQGGCTNMARLLHANEPAPAGYEIKYTCGTRNAMENAIADHNCRAVDRKDDKGIVTTIYACDPSLKNKLVGWVKSAF